MVENNKNYTGIFDFLPKMTFNRQLLTFDFLLKMYRTIRTFNFAKLYRSLKRVPEHMALTFITPCKLLAYFLNLKLFNFVLFLFVAQGSGDDTSMNGISFTCASGPSFNFDGNWGFWEGWSHTCSGGFTGAMVKVEGKQVK